MHPFKITGPAIVSVSGGRTSGYMLWRILEAHGGTLPNDVRAVFANTGREMPATLDFVWAMQAAWNVPITWVEYRRQADGHVTFEVVSHNSASRDGKPFEQLMAGKPMLPNPVARMCTSEMKIRTIKRWGYSVFGKNVTPTQVIGLRADEPRRVERALDPVRQKRMGREYRNIALPLDAAGVTVLDVARFWRAQPFDLMLAGKWEGNCDGCFLKSRASIMRMMADHPERMDWWARMEETPRGAKGNGRKFRIDREPYAQLAQLVKDMPRLPIDETMIEGGELCDAGCGT